jgi:hypothetical protein
MTSPRKFRTRGQRSLYMGTLSLRLAPQILEYYADRRFELGMRKLDLHELLALHAGVLVALDALQDLGVAELPLDLPDMPTKVAQGDARA